jgi:eukaryotic-like serine/threonine-protein kinase
VEELLEGETLRERLAPGAAAVRARRRARGQSRGLAAAHDKGHRPPRPQAREPLPHSRRRRQDPRLRPRPAPHAGALESIVHRCLEKRPDDRFQSARDLGFALEALGGTASGAAPGALPAAGTKFRVGAAVAAGIATLTLLAGAAIGVALSRDAPPPPSRLRTLTSSGADFSPTLSPDGRTIVFGSSRDGRPRIWIRQLGSGGEAPLTDGHDFAPRFFPDGQSILYAHSDEGRRSLHRIALVGGQPRKLIDDAESGDVSPDGTRIAFLRVDASSGQPLSVVGLARADGGDSREILRAGSGKVLFAPRFSPDGSSIVVIRGGQAGARGDILLLALDGTVRREIPALLPNSVLSAVAWSGDGRYLYYVQGDSSLGGVVSVEARLVRCEVASGRSTHLLWLPATVSTLAFASDGRLVFDAAVPRENLRQIPLADGTASDGGQWLTRGFGIDRQPIVSPDGRRVIFSSRRSGNLDIWELTLATGAVRPLTDDPGEDWDPALSPDGRQLLWSSNRSGTYEIWIADADGSNPRRITSDGDAENPTATPDGQWIVYASGAPANVGLWKIRADGTQATRLVAGYQLNPEVSPDGEHVLYRFTLAGSTRVQVRVLRVADGADVPFEIVAAGRGTGREGRARWLRGGRAIAFTAADERGVVGVYSQEFVPGVDTSATRRKLGGFDPDSFAESFGVARDDSFLIVAGLEQPSNLMSAENVPGLDAAARPPR